MMIKKMEEETDGQRECYVFPLLKVSRMRWFLEIGPSTSFFLFFKFAFKFVFVHFTPKSGNWSYDSVF